VATASETALVAGSGLPRPRRTPRRPSAPTEADSMGGAEFAVPRLLDAVRLVPRWRLSGYVLQLTEGREQHL
jgi:hypothetical protein